MIISWGTAIPGREQVGLEVFMTSMQYFGGLQAAGKVERAATYLNETGQLSHAGGYMVIEGSAAQIDAVPADPQYRRNLTSALHIVSDVSVNVPVTGNEIPQRIEMLTAVRSELGI